MKRFLFGIFFLSTNLIISAVLPQAPRRFKALSSLLCRLPTTRFIRNQSTSAAPQKNIQLYLGQAFHNTQTKFSVADYNQLTPVAINAMRALAQQHFADNDFTHVAHPTLARTDELIDEAQKICSEHSHAVVYGIGQGPAYLLETAHAIESINNKIPRRFKHAAFSGTFHQGYLTPRHGNLAFYIDPDAKKHPTLAQKIVYQKYLGKIGLMPEQITQRARNGFKTVVVDNVFSGGTLASFLYMLDHDKKHHNNLQQALSLRIYPGNGHTNFNYDFETQVISAHESVLKDFGNWYSIEATRLVPKYGVQDWGVKDPTQHTYHLAANLALFNIIDRLKTK